MESLVRIREHEAATFWSSWLLRLRHVEQHHARCAERWSEQGRGGGGPRDPPGPDSASRQRGSARESRSSVASRRPTASVSTREAGLSMVVLGFTSLEIANKLYIAETG